MENENKIIAATAFAGGVIVGTNWNRIKKFSKVAANKTTGLVSKTYKSAAKFASVQKEHVQDLIAESKNNKEEKKSKRGRKKGG